MTTWEMVKNLRWHTRDGVKVGLVRTRQARQTAGYAFGEGEKIANLDICICGMNFADNWRLAPGQESPYFNGHHWVVCRVDEMDEVVNDFGLVSP